MFIILWTNFELWK